MNGQRGRRRSNGPRLTVKEGRERPGMAAGDFLFRASIAWVERHQLYQEIL